MKLGLVLIFSLIAIAVVSILLFVYTPSPMVRVNNVSILVTIADEPNEQIAGLSGWQKLEDDHGMLFIFPDVQKRLFWMRDMKFPIDIVWIQNNRVTGVTKNVLPPHDDIVPEAWSPTPVTTVLEVPAYYTNQHGIATDTALTVTQ